MCKFEATFLPLSLQSSVHDKSEHVLSAGGITWDRHASEAARPPGSPAPPPALLRYSHPRGAPIPEVPGAGQQRGCGWGVTTILSSNLPLWDQTHPAVSAGQSPPLSTQAPGPQGVGGSHPRGSRGCYRTHRSGAPGLDAHPPHPSISCPGPSVHISLVPVPGHPHEPGTGRPPVGPPRPAHPHAHDGLSSSPQLPWGHSGTRWGCAGLDPAPASLCACHIVPSGLASTLCRNLSRHTSSRNHYRFRNSSCRCQHAVSSLPGP